MSKLFVVGYFGYKTNQLDGQTVKTRDIRRLLEEQYAGEVGYYDTQEFQYNRLSIFRMFCGVCKCRTLIYLPAHGNLKYIFPVVFLLSRLFNVKIHYFVVGGWLCEYLVNLPVHRFMLKRIAGIHVETERLKGDLEESYQFKNVDIFPNFRFFDYEPKRFDSDLKRIDSDKMRLVFVSRVEQSKGLDTLLTVAQQLQALGLDWRVRIDFYGQKKDDYYDTYLADIPMFNYKGVLEPQDVIPTIQKYDAMVFPTHYDGEGCPGILVEALSAAVPVVASDWKYNSEFIHDGVNGFLCDTFNAKSYVEAVVKLLSDTTQRQQMSRNAYRLSERYSAANARKLMSTYIEK